MPSTPSSSVTIKSIEAVRVISLRAIVANYRAQSALWDRVCAFANAHGIAIAGPCLTVYFDPDYKESDVDLEVCLPIADDAVVPVDTKEFRVRTLGVIPRAACVTHLGSYSRLPPTYTALFEWLGVHGERVNGPLREVYLAMNPDDTTEESYVTEIQAPLA
ncbi:hypothetical protein Poli38472_013675 [Pythium oligandrum]|uniref:AraC effector-binding domain-containing protein n=1 Tax=Pythium oligandrum TaxID=41045 RepID=A0A8K1CFG4_PYTOL|nr:hypothetical protein Poli38472_013675 [Pythium oligandrum]|eukprot:TMW61212.1 hypothetical protein Poli38472_013675 [Pythium oligandrum]